MPAHWPVFAVVVGVLLLVDLALLQRPGRAISVRTAWVWTFFLALLAGAYALWVGSTSGKQPAVEFITGYLIEGSLSIDNLFVFLLLFRALRLDGEQQRRVLLWGVLGAIVLRGVLILAGAALLARYAWVQYVFGAVLAFAALRLLLYKPTVAPARGPVAWIQSGCLKRISNQRLAFTSLLLVIAAIEATDLIFALDSIPAVLAVTRSPWIAFTSNIFAVLGLRSLYFALSSMLDRFRLLHYGLACILAFVAFKMLAARWIEIPALVSLGVILAILAIFAALSKVLPENTPARP
ncbi:MAG TPA: TerC/Alx family metal homeostasis membrane protein [Acidobacteriaceae bacterium]|jgi:tellurite resistance protein TerC|nr:TerC/Alx family metal homeostasis membrane protein [Acidobacteriaceae bacterium]